MGVWESYWTKGAQIPLTTSLNTEMVNSGGQLYQQLTREQPKATCPDLWRILPPEYAAAVPANAVDIGKEQQGDGVGPEILPPRSTGGGCFALPEWVAGEGSPPERGGLHKWSQT
eukprot:NODE_7001_length_593_cov_6.645221_g6004_i0.p2 GENE.NODE_7001_length_593_cov_6.645221_g6004_i0~~NODE_7001_length_593_cov_6.645221_g6004_i0.p2  ORF type:complete len:115 (+),score=3.10 NODE_7001_length_593_cov_6.645221_g6004_i0:61-405(+)